jgi:glycosyltransferase involved in cell wall biosynthesis
MTEIPLPRLLYVGDVPVESTYAGMVQLYKLLQTYPPDNICIAQTNIHRSRPDCRLSGVLYKELHVGSSRLLHTRLNRWYSLALLCRSVLFSSGVLQLLDWFKPDALLTVAHGYSWLTAAQVARRRQLPLHLFIHDDPLTTVSLPRLFSPWLDRQFERVYQQAASRLCVSPFMVEEYRRRYGIAGQLLYASRAYDAYVYETPAVQRKNGRFVCGYAGSVNSPSYVNALRLLARALLGLGGSLIIYGPFTEAKARAAGLEARNIEYAGVIPQNNLGPRLRADVDVLFVPMSFAPDDRRNMEISFASKLADYTATGLPLLIYGPSYCSAVRWARENSGVAELVDAENIELLEKAVKRLASDPQHRQRLAARALEVGEHFFSHRVAWRDFQEALKHNLHLSPMN